MLRHFINLLLCRLVPPSRMFGIRRYLWRLAGLKVDSGVCICGGGWIYGRGEVTIGQDSWLSPGVIINSHEDARVVIGKNCDIGPNVHFVTGSHEFGDSNRRAGKGMAQPIVVGDGCWIGANSVILGGTTIGDGCVVAAGSVAKSDLDANSLCAGVPCKIKRALAV